MTGRQLGWGNFNKTDEQITGRGNTIGAQRLSKKNKLLKLVDLDLNPPIKHTGLVSVKPPVRLDNIIKL